MVDIITKQEKTIFQELFNLNKKIIKLYGNLTTLEYRHLVDSIEYKNNIKYLSLCIELENELYQKLNYQKINVYLDYLQEALYENVSDYDVICCDFEDLLPHKRIYNRLFDTKKSLFIKDIQKEDNNSLKSQKIMIANNIHEDFLTLFIFFLNNYIQDYVYNEYRKDLIKAKYQVYFLNNQLEKMFLNNSIQDNIISCFSMADLFDFEETETNNIICNYINKYIKKYISSLLKITDNMYQDYDNTIQSLFFQALIKTSLEMGNIDFRIKCNNKDNMENMKNTISKKLLEEIRNKRNSYGIIKLRSEGIDL